MIRTIIVVPCYNEALRLRPEDFERYATSDPSTRFLLVDDGSTDATLGVLQKLERADPQRFGVIDLPTNQGKAEAVRRGMLAAFAERPDYVGYWDADLATPLCEIGSFVSLLEANPAISLVLGARVRLLGRSIDRRALRHYTGRVFATLVSLTLRMAVYDTQCGAKLFRRSPEIEALFAQRFVSNWVFDVEILARLIRARRDRSQHDAEQLIYELPLESWHDVPGSKVKPSDFLRGLRELLKIQRRYLSDRRAR